MASRTLLPTSQRVQVQSSTWYRDSHDLFDFEAPQLGTKSFDVIKTTTFFRSGSNGEVAIWDDSESQPMPGDPLLRLVQKDGAFWVDRVVANTPTATKKLWLVVKDLPSPGHRLLENDIMKLGRFKFRVRQLVSGQTGVQPELKLDDAGTVCGVEVGDEGAMARLCRICLLEGPGEDDPLIAPCQCKGSIEHVHLGCLRHWIKGRLNLSDAPTGSYFYRPLPCELCKAEYPAYIQNGKEKQPLVEVPWTQPPFIVLENMVRDSRQHATRGLHVISLADKVLKLGRGHESDVRIADVSISRCHATIRYNRGAFLLEDHQSKFGTLVAMKKPRLLENGTPISIQMGRTVMCLSAQGDTPAGATQGYNQPTTVAQDERNARLSLLQRTQDPAAGPGMASQPTGLGMDVDTTHYPSELES